MKKAILLLLTFMMVAGVFSCRKKGEQSPELKMDAEMLKDTTVIEFVDSVEFNFDTIKEGDKVEHTFRIKNVGQKNLLIARAFGSCGCTVPEYPKDPVKPGETASIRVTFNSEGKPNEQKKQVTVVCNTEKRNEVLFVSGFVKGKE